jgi:hypothetical protein
MPSQSTICSTDKFVNILFFINHWPSTFCTVEKAQHVPTDPILRKNHEIILFVLFLTLIFYCCHCIMISPIKWIREIANIWGFHISIIKKIKISKR